MKKLLLITLGTSLSFGSFAQTISKLINPLAATASKNHIAAARSISRTTNADSIILENGFTPNDSLFLYTANGADSGYTLGMNAFNFSQFAQRFDFTGADSSVQVLGVLTSFLGRVNPSSTNSAVLKVWSEGSPLPLQVTDTTFDSTIIYTGFPNTVLDSITVPFTNLGASIDSPVYYAFYFAAPTANLTNSFFIGYSVNYTWGATGGDTIGVWGTDFRTEVVIDTVSGDTIINVQNATYIPGSGWVDNGTGLQADFEYLMFPIVNTQVSLNVKGITKNNLTFFGNYPNPATDNTNIKFSLAANSDVTIQIMDMAGRTVNTLNEANLGAGMHIIPVSTASMPAGDYIYLVRTTSGDGMASKLTVIK